MPDKRLWIGSSDAGGAPYDAKGKRTSSFRPGDIRNWLLSWIDPTCTFFNKFEHDVGYTYSHKKI